MPSSPPRSLTTTLRAYGLAGLWALMALWMVWTGIHDQGSFEPGYHQSEGYGRDPEGAYLVGLAVSLVELALLYGVLQPWKKGGVSWVRTLGLLVLLAPWTMFSLFLCMHAGSTFTIHALWLLAVDIFLAVAFIVSVIERLRRSPMLQRDRR
jgi:hypothetical protein